MIRMGNSIRHRWVKCVAFLFQILPSFPSHILLLLLGLSILCNGIIGVSIQTRQTRNVFRRERSYSRPQCPSQNVRSLCPWKTVLVSDNARVPQDIQIRTCVSSIPQRDIGLTDIECENITMTKYFRLLNCAASNCIERVVVPVGCIPVFSCHIYSPP